MAPALHLFRRSAIALAALGGTMLPTATDAPAAVTTRTGTFKVVCTIVSDATTAKGSAFSVRVNVRGSGLDAYQIETGSSTVNKATNSQTVTIQIPYKWTFDSAQSTVPISLTVGTGTYPDTASVSTSLSVPLPANGAVTTVAIPVRI